jgi:hypothetical protein
MSAIGLANLVDRRVRQPWDLRLCCLKYRGGHNPGGVRSRSLFALGGQIARRLVFTPPSSIRIYVVLSERDVTCLIDCIYIFRAEGLVKVSR